MTKPVQEVKVDEPEVAVEEVKPTAVRPAPAPALKP